MAVEKPPKQTNLTLIKQTAGNLELAKDRKYARLAEEALAIEQEDAAKSGQIGFIPKWLVHATLPYKDPWSRTKSNPPAWGRTSGNVSLLIQPGYYQEQVEEKDKRGRTTTRTELKCYGYPYGSYPRLILAWIASEVTKNKNRRESTRDLVLGDSLTDFMKGLGKHNMTGGRNGSITLMKTQMQRLFSAQIAVTTNPNAIVWQNEGFRIADASSIETWWDPMNPGQKQLWQSHIRLTEKFHESLISNPVPVDIRIIRALASSPVAMDIYCWLTYRNATMTKSTKVPWEALMMQFGMEAKKHKFIETFKRALKDVLVLYPEAKVDTDAAGLLLIPSPPSIKKIA